MELHIPKISGRGQTEKLVVSPITAVLLYLNQLY
jgi:hypothetical protein